MQKLTLFYQGTNKRFLRYWWYLRYLNPYSLYLIKIYKIVFGSFYDCYSYIPEWTEIHAVEPQVFRFPPFDHAENILACKNVPKGDTHKIVIFMNGFQMKKGTSLLVVPFFLQFLLSKYFMLIAWKFLKAHIYVKSYLTSQHLCN